MSFNTTAVCAVLPFRGNLATGFDQLKRKKESSCIPDIVWLVHSCPLLPTRNSCNVVYHILTTFTALHILLPALLFGIHVFRNKEEWWGEVCRKRWRISVRHVCYLFLSVRPEIKLPIAYDVVQIIERCTDGTLIKYLSNRCQITPCSCFFIL